MGLQNSQVANALLLLRAPDAFTMLRAVNTLSLARVCGSRVKLLSASHVLRVWVWRTLVCEASMKMAAQMEIQDEK
jgi:hypothetical protein